MGKEQIDSYQVWVTVGPDHDVVWFDGGGCATARNSRSTPITRACCPPRVWSAHPSECSHPHDRLQLTMKVGMVSVAQLPLPPYGGVGSRDWEILGGGSRGDYVHERGRGLPYLYARVPLHWPARTSEFGGGCCANPSRAATRTKLTPRPHMSTVAREICGWGCQVGPVCKSRMREAKAQELTRGPRLALLGCRARNGS